MCKQILLLAAAVLVLILCLRKPREGFAAEDKKDENKQAQPTEAMKRAVIGVPITDTLCMDYQLVHSTPGMAEYCKNLGTVTNWM